MQYFQRLATGLPVLPLMHAIQRHPELWNANTARTTFENTPHDEVDDILIKFGDGIADTSSHWHPAFHVLPQVRPLIGMVREIVNAYQIDRVLVSRLRPGQRVLAHTDDVGYATEPDRVRYHLVLRGLGGNLYRNGDETVDMASGELWYFTAGVEHECFNANKTEDRVHLLVDCLVMP